MFGIGWTEMLVLGVVALIVIGPKDLPMLMNRMGKAMSAIRKMGSEFQREINKASGLDTITDLRKSITEPLKQTANEIQREFNKPLSGGGVAPSGIIKPKTAEAESVVDEIHAKIGTTPPVGAPAKATVIKSSGDMPPGTEPQPYVPFTKDAQEKYRAEEAAAKTRAIQPTESPKPVESPAPPEAIPPAKKPRAPRKPTVTAVADTPAPVDLLDGLAPIAAPKTRKPRAAKPKFEA